MSRKFFIPVLLYTLALFILTSYGAAINEKSSKTYSAVNAQMIVQGYEWGPAVPKIIVKFDDKVSGFDKDTFVITTLDTPRNIISVYNCDRNGKKKYSATKYLAFDLEVSTTYVEAIDASFGDASPFVYDQVSGLNSWATDYELNLSLAENKTFKVGNVKYGKDKEWTPYVKNLMENYIIPETEEWKRDVFQPTNANFTLTRASFAPKGIKNDFTKNPLIIWLHGAGEGGDDQDIVLLGNEVTALSKDRIQSYFRVGRQKGAYVLIVQTPTMWMDKGDGTYNDDIVGERQYSMYEDALFEAIQDYVKHNKDIDTKRIYVGGCSNGGYMTMNLMFEHGDYFAAYYPICEAYMNVNVSDEMIDRVKDYNIWFSQSEDDATVNPLQTTVPSFYRLIKAGAENVHFSYYNGIYGQDDPNAKYFGHYAWVYAFNDDVKKEFDNEKVLEDFDNVTFENGAVTSTGNYVTSANCNKEANMWTWLAAQRK